MSEFDFASAWLEEALRDYEAGKILAEAQFYSQAVFLAQQAAAKALKSILLFFKVPEGTGQHPAVLFETLLQKPEGAPLKSSEIRLSRLLKSYRLLEQEANTCRFPRLSETRIIYPRHEFKPLHSARALTTAREIIGIGQTVLK